MLQRCRPVVQHGVEFCFALALLFFASSLCSLHPRLCGVVLGQHLVHQLLEADEAVLCFHEATRTV